jgi:hypothetical protein
MRKTTRLRAFLDDDVALQLLHALSLHDLQIPEEMQRTDHRSIRAYHQE